MKVFVIEPISNYLMNKLNESFEITNDIKFADIAIIRNKALVKIERIDT